VTGKATWAVVPPATPPARASVSATGVVTGLAVGTASVTATYRQGTQSVTSNPVAVEVDALQSIAVSCTPYGEPGAPATALACLPSGRNFEVHCRALGRFAGNQTADVDITDQVTWATSNAAIARSTGLFGLTAQAVRQSFRIVGAGTAALSARQGSRVSPATITGLGIDPWVVQGTVQTPSELEITGPGSVGVGDDVQLRAMATLTGTGACAAPPARDFSLVVTWDSTPANRADVSFLGEVTGRATGNVTITAGYGTMSPAERDEKPLSVTP
jgi:hypothetical protein